MISGRSGWRKIRERVKAEKKGAGESLSFGLQGS